MRFRALASDYDGTLATGGRVGHSTIQALERLRRHGVRLILVTGRQLEELRSNFPQLNLFDRVVAENGALLYRPEGGELRWLAPLYGPDRAEILKQRASEAELAPPVFGRCIVATHASEGRLLLALMRDLSPRYQLVLNKDSAMLLPEGVDKATGLRAALRELGIAESDTVAIGDAENDQVILEQFGLGVAVANALDTLKRDADLVTVGAESQGFEELAHHLLQDSLPHPA